MAIKNNYAIAIVTLGDWLKKLAPVFQLMRRKKNKTNYTFSFAYFLISHALGKFQVIVRNSDWSTLLFFPVVIG